MNESEGIEGMNFGRGEVELRPAFLFDCPRCGRENMIRCVSIQDWSGEESVGLDNGMWGKDDDICIARCTFCDLWYPVEGAFEDEEEINGDDDGIYEENDDD